MTSETLDVLGAPMTIKSDGREMAAFVADHPIPSGYFVPQHRHEADDEMLLVVEGELTLLGEAGESKLPAGSSVTYRRGTLHGFRNDTKRTVRFDRRGDARCPGSGDVPPFRPRDEAGRRAACATGHCRDCGRVRGPVRLRTGVTCVRTDGAERP
jgi:Cupin domain